MTKRIKIWKLFLRDDASSFEPSRSCATGRKRGNGTGGSITASYVITMTSTWNVDDYKPSDVSR